METKIKYVIVKPNVYFFKVPSPIYIVNVKNLQNQ